MWSGSAPAQLVGVGSVVVALVAVLVVPVALASHGAFPTSQGVYRIPYEDGTTVTVSRDHHDHAPVPNRIDMFAANAGTPLVAAAGGWIRAIVDFNGNSPGAGDGVDINGAPHDDSLEHSCTDSDTVAGSCSDYNNYVWIEHPNGEWTKYSHVGTGTATGNGWSVGDWIDAGEEIGLEGDIGAASGRHLHWEVGLPSNPNDSTPFSTLGGFLQGTNIVGLICDIPNNLFESGEDYTADPCANNAAPTADAGGPYVVDEGSTVQLDGTASNDPDGNPLTYGWAPDGGLDDATLAQPTFTGVDDAIVFHVLTVYDQVEALRDSDVTFVTVENVAPAVDATGDTVDEGSPATVSASVTDPGTQDTHTATIDWDDGTPPQAVSVAQLEAGVDRTFFDDAVLSVDITVTDDDGGIGADTVGVTVLNVPPTVTATGDAIDEGGTATVSATFTDPGALDTHTATIDWDDGTPAEPVTVGALAGGIDHVYGDNGVFMVTVTVTDDDGGVGMDTVAVTVTNVDPVVDLDTGDEVAFPGGDYHVVTAGAAIGFDADGTDVGSDDLTFQWSFGPGNIYFNNGIGPDPLPSPHGVFPFAASDSDGTVFANPGVVAVALTLFDDDDGSDDADTGVVVVGTADKTRGDGWWEHQYSGNGKPHLEGMLLDGYLDIVNAVSAVFSEETLAADHGDVHGILSPGGDKRARAEAALMVAWLQFASGAVAWDADVPLGGGSSVGFLDLMFQAEATIADAGASNQDLKEIELLLNRVRHAG